MAATTGISLEEYLQTSYERDPEYIDGVLKEKPVVQFVHGRVQTLLGVWFWQHQGEWNTQCAVETRTQVSRVKVRLPDLVVVSANNDEQGTLTRPPLVAIEVLSPTDSYADLRARAEDLTAMGVRNVWLIDPDRRTGEIWRDGYWQPAGGDRLEAVESPIFLDLAWVWAELDR
jgi:Uma2 family endonuclease